MLPFSKVRAVSSYNFVSVQPPITRSVIQNSTIIPLSDCRVMLATLEKYKPKFNAVKVDTQIYAKEQLFTISKVHQLLEVKKKVEEVIWINNYSYTVPLECSRIGQGTLSKFMEILSNTFNDTCVSKTFPSLLTCDICLLSRNRGLAIRPLKYF